MNSVKIKRFVGFIIFIIITVALGFLQLTSIATFKIGNASVVFVVPMTVLCGFYFKEYRGFIFGFIIGALTDVFSSTLCFNTVILSIFGLLSGMLVSHLFNSNLVSVSVLSVSASIIYFFTKWLILYAFSDAAAGYLLVEFMLPSAIYTILVGLLLYFLLNPFYKRMPIPEKN